MIIMKCPSCGFTFRAHFRFCGQCGTRLYPQVKGSHWAPLLILFSLALSGLLLWYALPGNAPEVPDSPTTAPVSAPSHRAESLSEQYIGNIWQSY